MDPFVVKVLLSLVVGITWVMVSTYLAEKISGKVGGLIVGLPSTAVISILFVGLTQGIEAAITAARVVPFGAGLYCFYYLSYLIISKRGYWIGFLSSFSVWLLFAYVSAKFAPTNFIISILIWLIIVSISIQWVVKNIHINYSLIPAVTKSSPTWIKATVTGVIISLIVIMGKLAGPIWGGVLTTFPALVTSTLLLSYRSKGLEFTRLIMKNVLISTTTSIGVFAILAYHLYQFVGLGWGTVLAYLGLAIVSIPYYIFVIDKIRD